MKTVTQEFTEVVLKPDAVFKREVSYKRRLWDESTNKYIWETNWTVLEESDIVNISPIVWQLDSDQLNEFKVSNVTILADNSVNQWRSDNQAGVFGQDEGSSVHLYEPYFTKFKIQVGYELGNGTFEMISLFSGVATEFMAESEAKTMQITVQGLEALLIGASAEDIATDVVNESIGTGNGVLTEFDTLNPGVGRVKEVYVDGELMVEGDDYTVSDTNEPTLPAKVTFSSAVGNGLVVIASYFYWPQTLSFKGLITALLDAADIPTANQDVQDVIFANDVINTNSITNQTDFDTGTYDDSLYAGGRVDINYANNFVATDWTTSDVGWNNGTPSHLWSSDGTKLNCVTTTASSEESSFFRGEVPNAGVWKATIMKANNSAVYLEWSFADIVIRLLGTTASLRVGGVQRASWTYAPGTENDYVVYRSPAGQIYVYMDTDLKGSYTASGISSPTSLMTLFLSKEMSTAVTTSYVEAISVPEFASAGTWTSPVTDLLVTPMAWGQFTSVSSADGGLLQFHTRTSTDGSTWADWDDAELVSAGGVVSSPLRRYIQIRILLYSESGSMAEPNVTSFSYSWTTSGTSITMAHFVGMSVYDAIQEIGQFTNYEYGFTPDEVFFFRTRPTGTSIMTLTQSNVLSSISPFDTGNDRTFGTVRITYGDRVRVATSPADYPDAPGARLSKKTYELDLSTNIIIPETADIVTGIANGYLFYYSKPRPRGKLNGKLLPQFDLSDVVTIKFINNTPPIPWYLGSDTIYHGQTDAYHWGEKDQLVYGKNARIVSVRYDTSQRNAEYEVEIIP